MIDYPKSLPTDALMLMLDKVRGNPVSMAEAVQAAWNISGYGLSLALPTQLVVGDSGAISEETALEELIAYGKGAESGEPHVVGIGVLPALALSMVVKLALKFLMEHLS